MADLIDRQQAIDVLEERLQVSGYSNVALVSELNRSIGYLMQLPSVQPEVIRCKDCKRSRFFDPCFYCYEMGGEVIVPENGFCFKAERKEDA